jgi:RNA-directed DNA polymerase
VVKRRTSPSRFSRALKSISQWCRSHRHQPMAAQHQTLCQKLRGHFAYYGITGSSVALSRFRWVVIRIWRKWLSRRRRKGTIPWDEFTRMMERYALPPPIPIHSVCRPVARSRCEEPYAREGKYGSVGPPGAPGEQSPGANRPFGARSKTWHGTMT